MRACSRTGRDTPTIQPEIESGPMEKRNLTSSIVLQLVIFYLFFSNFWYRVSKSLRLILKYDFVVLLAK